MEYGNLPLNFLFFIFYILILKILTIHYKLITLVKSLNEIWHVRIKWRINHLLLHFSFCLYFLSSPFQSLFVTATLSPFPFSSLNQFNLNLNHVCTNSQFRHQWTKLRIFTEKDHCKYSISYVSSNWTILWTTRKKLKLYIQNTHIFHK